MKTIRPLLVSFVLLIIVYCTFNIYTIEKQRRVLKEDLIELSKIKYGLFSVEEWKQILSGILTKKIEELNFNSAQKEEMRIKISSFLTRAMEDFENRFYEEKSKSLLGWVQGGITSLTGMFDKMKKDVPVFTDQILDFLNDAGNRKKIKEYIMEKLNDYTDKTFSKMDYAEHNRILAHYSFGDRQKTLAGLQDEIDALQQASRKFIIVLFSLVFVTGLLIAFSGRATKAEFFLYTLICFCLLLAGIILPMIEIDARIEEMSFTLLGEAVSFKDQVLYYKSKSILEVVRLMLSQGKWDVLMVGMLVLLFSVVFPVSKLFSSVIYLFNPQLHTNRFIRFMVFRTGKWSMADVMVIAIFMSYIGFSGILTEQLNQLEGLTQSIDILTTNKSSLQIGFFLFSSFALLSLLVAHSLQYKKTESSPYNPLSS